MVSVGGVGKGGDGRFDLLDLVGLDAGLGLPCLHVLGQGADLVADLGSEVEVEFHTEPLF